MGLFNKFKKPARRKSEPEERSKGGSPIYRYDEPEERGFRAGEPTPYGEEIEKHMEAAFPGRETTVFHELLSDLVHIDVYIMKPKDDEDFVVLYTSGMSALPMSLPESLLPEYKHLERAELMMILPAWWDISGYQLNKEVPEHLWWPVGLLKFLARFPHEYQTWLGWGHTVPNGADYEPYDPSTKLNGCMLAALRDEIAVLKAQDGTQINFYTVIPLYREEMDYKLDHSAEELLEKLQAVDGGGMVLFPDRPNVCTPKE